jgi:hypothetical protein
MVAAVAVEYALLALGAAAALLALLRLRAIARFAAQPLAPASAWRPPATVLLPVRGEHHGFADNLRALASQDYPDYELLLVADSFDDPAARAVRALQADLPRLRLVVSEEPRQGWGSGKIAALVGGLRHVRPSSEVLVFADADIRPTPSWLASLVAPLADPAVGGVTGFQAYLPATRATPWSALRDAFVSSGLQVMTNPRTRFLWGGSCATRRADLERSAVREHWKVLPADDTGVTNAIKALGLRLEFALGAFVPGQEDWDGPETRRWVVRELTLARAAVPGLFRVALLANALAAAVQAMGMALLLAGPTPLLRGAGLLLLGPTFLGWAKALLRWRLVDRAVPEARARPRGERAAVVLATALLPWLLTWGMAKALQAKTLRWRGREYPLAR